MIKGIVSNSQFLTATGGSTSFPYVPYNSNNPIQGMIRINGQDMQVFDGSSWINMSTSYATVDLTGEAQTLLQWAREEKNRQIQREARIRSNPALKKAYEAIKRAEENFDILDRIVGDDVGSEAEQVQASP